MKRIWIALLAAAPASAFAASIAIIDSGTDYKHKELAGQYLVNKGEIAGNKIDDDQNGVVDDVYGWNIAENNAEVIDYSYLARLKPTMPDIRKFFEVQARTLDGTATQAEKDWMKAKREDQKFIKELQVFGNFAHGSHVAGITAGLSTTRHPDNHPFAIKLIPTEVKLPFSVLYSRSESFRALVQKAKGGIPTSIKEMLFELGLRFFAKQQAKVFGAVGKYVNDRKSDVANGSFGTGYAQAKMIVKTLYEAVFTEEERSDAKIDEFTLGFLQQVLIHSRTLVTSAPDTLFVFAAGNDGSDNSVFPVSPANIKEDNTITVAATLRNRELAVFSNYGTKVDVAAPGVAISSLYPGDDRGLMSGTSQAAPYVAGVAAEIKNQNSKLKPVEIKEIIKGTVDTKDWLVGKVSTSGIVNAARAFEAAKLSKDLPVHEAITVARSRVRDQDIDEAPSTDGFSEEEFFMLPLPSPIH